MSAKCLEKTCLAAIQKWRGDSNQTFGHSRSTVSVRSLVKISPISTGC